MPQLLQENFLTEHLPREPQMQLILIMQIFFIIRVKNTTLKRIKIFNTKIDDYPTQTDLQDAFYAVIDIEKTANTAFIQTIELKRPVAKITVKEKNISEFKKLKKMTAFHD